MSDWRQEMLLTADELVRLHHAQRLLLRGPIEGTRTRRKAQRLKSLRNGKASSGAVFTVANAPAAS